MKLSVLAVSVVARTFESEYPVYGDESIMDKKEFGTCTDRPHPRSLKWGVDFAETSRISCFNRKYAELKYSFLETSFMNETASEEEPMTFYDPVNLVPIFKAPIGRSWEHFIEDSTEHGWPQFQDQEVVWENVRSMENGEIVTINGVHLGHNFPEADSSEWANRYCINLLSIAGIPKN